MNVAKWTLWCQQAARTQVAGPEVALFSRPASQRWLLRNAGQPAGATPIYAPPNRPFCETGKGILPKSAVSFACQADKHHLCAVVYKRPLGPDFVCSCTCGHAH
jgi:hypothetical protein